MLIQTIFQLSLLALSAHAADASLADAAFKAETLPGRLIFRRQFTIGCPANFKLCGAFCIPLADKCCGAGGCPPGYDCVGIKACCPTGKTCSFFGEDCVKGSRRCTPGGDCVPDEAPCSGSGFGSVIVSNTPPPSKPTSVVSPPVETTQQSPAETVTVPAVPSEAPRESTSTPALSVPEPSGVGPSQPAKSTPAGEAAPSTSQTAPVGAKPVPTLPPPNSAPPGLKQAGFLLVAGLIGAVMMA